MSILVLLGRIFFALVFILSAPRHFSQGSILYAESMGVPMPELLVPCSGILAFIGGLSVLLGLKARFGAWLLVVFLVPVTLMMHAFWSVGDVQVASLQQIMFFKNLSMLGGALLITQFGSGPLSIRN